MKKSAKITYYVLLVLFSLMMVMDGIAGIMQVEGGKEAFSQLNYPYYLMTIIGTAKLLGGLALLQPKFKMLKEWAFAGFTFNFLGAAASWAFSNGPIAFIIMPLVMLGVMLLIYFLWKKLLSTDRQQPQFAMA
ncbi:MAG TPA: DoxX family protein [Flavobacterium sp.]|jgi:uncharacterized membrane protein YphA (DoxX/SURF4 family)